MLREVARPNRRPLIGRRLVPLVAAVVWATACEPAPETRTEVDASSGTEDAAPAAEALPAVVGEEAAALDAFLRDSLETPFHGQVLLAMGNRVVLFQAYGLRDIEGELPTTLETRYDIGSITKPFVATAFMHFVEQRLVSPEDTVGRFLPGTGDEVAGLSMHELLTHTAGLPTYSGRDYDPTTRNDFLEWTRSVELESRGEFSYSNPGFTLVALVLEEITATPIEEVLDRIVFTPAGLECTGYRLPDWRRYPIAVGYEDGARWGTPFEHQWLEDGPGWNLRGNGGLVSGAGELFRLQQALVSGRVIGDSPRAMMWRRQEPRAEDDVWYGYGWTIYGSDAGDVINHSGSNGRFFADLRWWRAADVVTALTTNSMDRDQTRRIIRRVGAWVEEMAEE